MLRLGIPHLLNLESLSPPHFTQTSKSDYSLSMRTLFIIPLVLMSLVSCPSWGLTYNDLVKRDGFYYKKFSDLPFTGEIEGRFQGKFKNGKKEGYWVRYWENGQLWMKGSYIDGKREGYWVTYKMDGTVYKFVTGTFKNGVKVSN